jgi:hypothetical protein
MAEQAPMTGGAPEEVADFVRGYVPDHAVRIRFAWNGKHASGFVDSNQSFRSEVIEYVVGRPGEASPELLTHLFRESASWASEAWSAPKGFVELAAALLTRRGEEALPDFRWGLGQSFDTFGACHQMRLDPVLARRLQGATEAGIATAPPGDKEAWAGMRDLFAKLAAGTARQGWVQGPPGTPVSFVRVVPSWGLKLAAFWKRLVDR